jgi:PTS system ascorbate-specific IIA component
MLSRTIEKNLILINIEAENFEEAIRKSTAPLVTDGFVTQNYVDRIIEISQETGPYIVITKNVALPHAPGDSGAIKTTLGFTKLKNPVISGNKANDPVKYLFPLSASDSSSHIELLSELATLLGSQEFIDQLETIDSKEGFITLLQKFEGGNTHA